MKAGYIFLFFVTENLAGTNGLPGMFVWDFVKNWTICEIIIIDNKLATTKSRFYAREYTNER